LIEHLPRLSQTTTQRPSPGFVSLEAAIVAVADAQGLDTRKAHWRKAEVASEQVAAR